MSVGNLWVLLTGRDTRLRGCKLLVVGLGNPGERYAGTRHNIGFRVADRLIAGLQNVRFLRGYHAQITVGILPENSKLVVAKPQTYMNRSGEAIRRLLRACDILPAACLVVVDDIHLPVGKLRIRREGSDGGHNGLRSVCQAIGNSFPRIRIGVGPAPEGESLINFVLGPFSIEQERVLEEVLIRAADAVLCVALEGIDSAMNRFNN